MIILDSDQIKHKISRIAWEILERHYGQSRVYILGINNKGYALAEMIFKELDLISQQKPEFMLHQLRMDPADPLKSKATILGLDISELSDKHIIIVDDVANTGRTLFYAFMPLMEIIPAQVECAVMVDRKHKLFPVQADYVGLSLATTLMENIEFTFDSRRSMKAELV